jgi:hypothetical protein
MGLMGFEEHRAEGEAAGRLMRRHFLSVDTPGGEAYVFDHGFDDREFSAAPTTYARYTMPIVLELALMGLERFRESDMRRFANTVAHLMLDEEPFEPESLLAPDVAGGRAMAGLLKSQGAREGTRVGSLRFPYYVPFARFDESGRIVGAVDAALEPMLGNPHQRIVLSAGMLFATTGDQPLAERR